MCFEKIVKKLKKNMEWYDFSFLKLSMFFVTLSLVTAWPAFNNFVMGIAWQWYLVLSIVFAVPLFKKMF